MRAVIWTDCLQVTVMYGAIIGILIKGINDVGGINVVWEESKKTGRIEFNE